MIRRCALALALLFFVAFAANTAQAQQAYGRAWGNAPTLRDWERLYHYPYVYYPQNFYAADYYRSAQNMYYRYPTEMRVPVYNRRWHNEFPEPRRYHMGHHFILDQF